MYSRLCVVASGLIGILYCSTSSRYHISYWFGIDGEKRGYQDEHAVRARFSALFRARDSRTIVVVVRAGERVHFVK